MMKSFCQCEEPSSIEGKMTGRIRCITSYLGHRILLRMRYGKVWYGQSTEEASENWAFEKDEIFTQFEQKK